MSDDAILSIAVVVCLIIGFALGYSVSRLRQNSPKYAGEIEVYEGATGRRVYSLNLNCEPEDLLTEEKVIFHIVAGRA